MCQHVTGSRRGQRNSVLQLWSVTLQVVYDTMKRRFMKSCHKTPDRVAMEFEGKQWGKTSFACKSGVCNLLHIFDKFWQQVGMIVGIDAVKPSASRHEACDEKRAVYVLTQCNGSRWQQSKTFAERCTDIPGKKFERLAREWRWDRPVRSTSPSKLRRFLCSTHHRTPHFLLKCCPWFSAPKTHIL